MKKLIIAALSLSLLLSATVQNQNSNTANAQSRSILDNVVMVVSPDESTGMVHYGTGFFISPYGHILTNYHVLHGRLFKLCVRSQEEAGIVCHNSDKLTLIAENRDLDLALLQLPQTKNTSYNGSYFTFGNSDNLKAGDELKVLGYPADDLVDLNITKGTVSGFLEGYILTDARVLSGNSGSPILDKRNKVIGVAVAVTGADYDNAGVIIPSNDVKKWLISVGFDAQKENKQIGKTKKSKNFLSEAGNFSINFPGKPISQTREESGKTFHDLAYLRGNQVWMVTYADMTLEEFMEFGSENSDEGNVLSETEVAETKLSKYMGGPAIYFKAKTDGVYMIAQMYFVNGRFYMIAVANRAEYPNEQKARSFIKSFKVLK